MKNDRMQSVEVLIVFRGIAWPTAHTHHQEIYRIEEAFFVAFVSMTSPRGAERLLDACNVKDCNVLKPENFYVFGSGHPDQALSVPLDASVNLGPCRTLWFNPLCAYNVTYVGSFSG